LVRSLILGSSSTHSVTCGSRPTFRRWRRLLPSERKNRPPSQTYQIGVTWDQPSSRFEARRPTRFSARKASRSSSVRAFSLVAVVRFRRLRVTVEA
jgi:hypothetical protein